MKESAPSTYAGTFKAAKSSTAAASARRLAASKVDLPMPGSPRTNSAALRKSVDQHVERIQSALAAEDRALAPLCVAMGDVRIPKGF
jgi:hypothetical protein